MNNEHKKFITVQEASEFSGLGKQTIRKMVDNSQVDGYKTPTNQRKINYRSLQEMCNNLISDKKEKDNKRKNFIYTRVSTKKQVDDLSRQVEFLRQPEYIDYNVIRDIGSGINFKRKGLQTILDACIQGIIGEVVIAHRDRLCRFAFELIESIITKAGGTIKVFNNEKSISREEELSQDLLAIIHVFNCRQMGKRSYKCKTREPIENNKNEDIPDNTTKENS